MNTYEEILSEMHKALEEFSTTSQALSGYQYEKTFRDITDKYNLRLFQVSQGKVPKSKNESLKVQTSFGKINVKKGHPLSILPMGFKISALLQDHMCRIGSKLPFDEASDELTSLLGIQSNGKQIERLCPKYGDQIDQVDWEKAHSQGVQLKISEHKSAPVYCMADGSMLLTREENWKEIKLGRIFSESQHITDISKGRGMITHSTYCAHFGNSNDFWERFTQEIPSRRKLVFICDGAKWLWNNIDDLYPESTQILDFYHCKEHICQFSKEYFKNNSVQKQKFIDDIIERLTSQKVESALEKIAELECSNQNGLKSKKEKLLAYLSNNKKRIDYGKFKEEGLLIGSGPIEAANRDVIQKRLKLSGQRWTVEGAQQVVNLRVALKSNRWDKIISLINGYQNAA